MTKSSIERAQSLIQICLLRLDLYAFQLQPFFHSEELRYLLDVLKVEIEYEDTLAAAEAKASILRIAFGLADAATRLRPLPDLQDSVTAGRLRALASDMLEMLAECCLISQGEPILVPGNGLLS